MRGSQITSEHIETTSGVESSKAVKNCAFGGPARPWRNPNQPFLPLTLSAMRPNHPRNAERKARKNRKKILTVPALVEGGRGRRNRPVLAATVPKLLQNFVKVPAIVNSTASLPPKDELKIEKQLVEVVYVCRSWETEAAERGSTTPPTTCTRYSRNGSFDCVSSVLPVSIFACSTVTRR
jgi:hypothetical protein